jgi:hypothetical protein
VADYGGESRTGSKGPGSGRRARRNANAERRASGQAVAAPPSRNYGDRKASEDAQSLMPISDAAVAQRADLSAALAAAQSQTPGQGLAAPTSRPGEPVTAGLPTGPGAGPSALADGTGGLSDADIARALYRRFPTEAMRKLVERADRLEGLDQMMGPGMAGPGAGPTAAPAPSPAPTA